VADDTPTPTRFPHTPITLTVDEIRDALTTVMQSMCDCENPAEANTHWPRATALIDALVAAVSADTQEKHDHFSKDFIDALRRSGTSS
jgi:hypothetical protein